jgi:hypothetical protein
MEGEKVKVRVRPIYVSEDCLKRLRESFEKYESGGLRIKLVGDYYLIVADERGISLNEIRNYSATPIVWFKSFSELESYLKKANEQHGQDLLRREKDKQRMEQMTKLNIKNFLRN